MGKMFACTGMSCLAVSAWALLQMADPRADEVVPNRATASKDQDGSWLSVGRTASESHYSPLESINDRNVKELGLAWFLDLPNQGTLQATPLAVEGVLYFSGSNGRVYAANGTTGQKLWEFDPDLAHHLNSKNALLGANRGVAFWKDKVYVGIADGRLIALDAKTGAIVWSVQTFEDTSTFKSISGAPRVFNGKVVIGYGGEAGRGYVTAYDADSGKKLWRFYTVPGDPAKGFENAAMAMAAKTWSGKWWQQPRNGTVWDSMTYDPQFNRLYLGTANGSPFDANERSPGGGDNLFVSSIVALDADTGQYVWHYQVTPRDTWDYDATQTMILADLTVSGKSRPVLMQASKNGFFYVIDRTSGRLISAEKFAKATWADRIDRETGRPVETPKARDYSEVIWPSQLGAHAWQPMSYNPNTGLAYVPTSQLGMRITSTDIDLSPKAVDDGSGSLLAWDPAMQKKRWEVRYYDSYWNGGTLTTGGNLVFQGTGRGEFSAYDANTGEKLWSFNAGLGIIAAPMTYAINGIQYISVLVGYGGTANFSQVCDYGWHFGEQQRRLLTFALGYRTPLPPGKPPRYTVDAVDDPSFVIDKNLAASGAEVYGNCANCHGARLENIGSFAPDLRESALAMNWDAFTGVVREGALANHGMPKFDELSDHDLRALYMYIRLRAREAAQPPL